MRHLLAALAIWLVLAAPAAAAQDTAPGWIGISYEARSARDGTPRIVVTDVRGGSPAASAGIQAGDRLVSIGDLTRVEQLMSASVRLALRAGQLVEIGLERDGRPLELMVRAAARPIELGGELAVAVSFQTDSVVESMFRAMDSLRVQLLQTNERTSVVAPRAPRSPVAIAQTAPDAVSVPFEFFVFRGEQHDSLVRAMERLNRDMAQLRQREAERVRELQRGRRGNRDQDQDARLREIRRALAELDEESDELQEAMREAARATAGVEYLLPRTPAPTPDPWTAAPMPEPYSPLTPYLLGSNRVAGAQVIEVQPELGTYFGVERGLLVIDVTPGTPAAIAGLRPGDVVTRLDQVGVRTVDELRFGVAQAGDTLPVTVMRRGSSLQLLLRRR